MHIIDMHCDTLLECYRRNQRIRENNLSVNLQTMKKNGVMAQFFAIFLPPEKEEEKGGCGTDSFGLFESICDLYHDEITINSDMISPVLQYEDLIANMKQGKMSSLLTVEDGRLLDGKADRSAWFLIKFSIAHVLIAVPCGNHQGLPLGADLTA